MNYRKYISKYYKIWGGCILLQLSSCQYFNPKESGVGQRIVVATVGDKQLHLEDLNDGSLHRGTDKDSVENLHRLANAWVKHQLLIQQAESEGIDLSEINRRVEAYRKSLLVYEFKKRYVRRHMQSNVSESEIDDYFTKNKANFELKQNIVRGTFVQLPKSSPQLKNFRKWFRSSKSADQDKLKAYCFQYATNYALDEEQWVAFDELVKNTPFGEVENKGNFLKKNTFAERSTDEMIYFLKIKEFRGLEEVPPLSFVREQVADIVRNKRKVELLKNLEKEIYNRAERNHEIEIFPTAAK
ncbi:peptidyl-prolyl cis-trans isomerase [Persicobacter psychrovividus]|uniref:Peptidyl-prolyl cis-trans isomerase n=1 Tax=Persicobacter psychrovividus TaxID=387638 RepID=A0ABM7VGD5_9BACT|nr:hypothetical protein PEPS_23100 [Persicobacter psychrovividus]